MILRRMFNNKKSGFFIDIGAHHPKGFRTPMAFTNMVGEELILMQCLEV